MTREHGYRKRVTSQALSRSLTAVINALGGPQ